MNIETATTQIGKALEKNLSVYVHGSPGIGKSDMIRQIAEARKERLIVLHAAQLEPIDMRGLPTLQEGVTKWITPSFFPKGGEGIFFLDEISSAAPAMQATLFQFILDKRIGDYHLPTGWKIVAAGNLDTDRGVTYKMSTPLASRFLHINLEVNNDSWLSWASANEIDAMVIAFIRFRPALLQAFDPKAGHQTFPCPRTWHFVSRFISGEDYATISGETIAGIVGEGAGAEFTGFLKVYAQLPEIAALVKAPDKTPVPTDPAALYAISAALARKDLIAKHAPEALTYIMRMPPEFAIMTVRDMAKLDASHLCNTQQFKKFSEKYGDFLVESK